MVSSWSRTQLLTVPEFLRAARISRSTFYLLLRQGEGPPITKLGGRTFVAAAAAEEWLRSRQTGTPRPAPTEAQPVMGDRTAMARSAAVLRALTPHNSMAVALAVTAARDGTIPDVARLSGVDEATVRQVVPTLDGIVATRIDPAGQTRLALASPRIERLLLAVRDLQLEEL